MMNKSFSSPASKEATNRALKALEANGIATFFVENGKEAKDKALEILPKGAEAMTMSSVTLQETGIDEAVNDSGNYDSVREKFSKMNPEKDGKEMRRIGAAPDWALGSAHAVTEDGKIIVASNTGSQLPAYAYGAGRVIFVIGAQKIVKDIEEGMRRIYEHSLPLESERAKKVYGAPGSAVNKILMIDKEVQKGRIIVIVVNEVIGY